jgi:hypothetical protein
MLFLLALPAACQDQMKSQGVAPPEPTGRYQIVFSPHAARDTFLLDTQTGKVWQVTQFSFLNDEPVVWNFMPRIDNDVDYMKVVSDFGRKPPPAPAAAPRAPTSPFTTPQK